MDVLSHNERKPAWIQEKNLDIKNRKCSSHLVIIELSFCKTTKADELYVYKAEDIHIMHEVTINQRRAKFVTFSKRKLSYFAILILLSSDIESNPGPIER